MGYTINMTDKNATKENIRRISIDLVETVNQLEYIVSNDCYKIERILF